MRTVHQVSLNAAHQGRRAGAFPCPHVALPIAIDEAHAAIDIID